MEPVGPPNIAENPEYKGGNEQFVGLTLNKELMIRDMKPAIDYMNATGETIYCGEYGVIDESPLESRIHWHRDFIDITKALKIGRACWSYKQMNFGLVDKDGHPASPELIKIASEK